MTKCVEAAHREGHFFFASQSTPFNFCAFMENESDHATGDNDQRNASVICNGKIIWVNYVKMCALMLWGEL